MPLRAHLSSVPTVNKLETAGIITFALLSPLWFVNLGGINLNPADLILLFVVISFLSRTGTFPYPLSQLAVGAIVVFLAVVGLSLIWSSNKLGGLLSFIQYLFIFFGVVPIVSHALRDRSVRWQVFLAIWAMTTGLTLLGLFQYLFNDVNQLRNITLWYGNQNNLYWLVASSFITNIALTLEDSLSIRVRLGLALLAILEVVIIAGGMTLSALLIVGGGLWLFSAWFVNSHYRGLRTAFTITTVLAGLLTLVATIRFWDFVYFQGSLHVRIPQYTTAIMLGVQHFPLGMGIDAYGPSVHNFALDYFVEVGIIGAGAALLLVTVWCRDVLIRTLRYPTHINPFEFAFVAIFSAYILVILFQPIPVRRFWWLIFAATWAITWDCLGPEDVLHD